MDFPRFSKVETNGVYIDINKIPSSDKNDTKIEIPLFSISKLILKNTEIIVDKESFKFDINSLNLHYNGVLEVKKIGVDFKSIYANAKIDGTIASDRLKGKMSVKLDNKFLHDNLTNLKGLSNIIEFKLDATLDGVHATTNLHTISVNSDENLSINNVDLDFTYFTKDEYFSVNTAYILSYFNYEASLRQSALFSIYGAYYTKLNGELTKQKINLPFKSFSAEVAGDLEEVTAEAHTDKLKLTILSSDYENFAIKAKGEKVSLSFLDEIPDVLKNDFLSFKSEATLTTSPFSMAGVVDSDDIYAKIKTTFEIDAKSALYHSKIVPKEDNKLFKEYELNKFLPISIILYDDYISQIVNLDANLLNATLFKSGDTLRGWGDFCSSNFDILGDFAKDKYAKVTLLAKLPSLKTLLSNLKVVSEDKYRFYDGEIDLNTTLLFSEKMVIKSSVKMPWYLIRLDSQTSYSGENLSVDFTSTNNQITVDKYSLEFKNQKIYSNKSSKILVNENNNIEFKEFWIYDNLLLTGMVNTAKMEGDIHLFSNRFNYVGKEGNVTLKADIRADFDISGRQNIEGEITLLDGVISYMPATDYAVMDNDIIIIQDMKKQEQKNRSINIHIGSAKPISFKTKEIDILFTPDITLFEEPQEELKIFGMLTINNGEISGGGKTFEFEKSEIYFYGAKPINPYLNLNMHYYTLDYIDIEIYVTNTLNAPVLILASKPAMSQNDIMSYILFGESASSVFDGTGDGNKVSISSLLLGTGIKQIFNETTGVKIDTLNILTNKEGTLGYEIGARISKDIRVIYKNDTVSSVILQYSLSKSIRVDVDVHDEGQGVFIIYVKDF